MIKLLLCVSVVVMIENGQSHPSPSSGQSYSFISIPPQPYGYSFMDASRDAPIQFEVFLDLICPDSKNAFPTLKKLADHYGNKKMRLSVLSFPLPYHKFAYLAAQGVNVVASVTNSSTKTWDYMKMMFDAQPAFSDKETVNMTTTEIIENMGKIAARVGVPSNTWSNNILSSAYDTRTQWKYGCRRGAAGTPWFLINGVTVMGQPTWSVEQWQKLIDPLIQQGADCISQ